MLLGTGLLIALAVLIAALLARAAAQLAGGDDRAVERVNALLPQIQCAQCGYPGCRPYAEALVAGRARLDQCPPGGEATVRALAALLPRPATGNGALAAGKPAWTQVALINEPACIGCARCMEVCPVDAILGAPRLMHTVLASDCTGCELCLPACPVDCIRLVPRPAFAAAVSPA